MELTGKIFKVLPLQTGEGKNGPWKKQDFVIEMENGKFNKKVCVSMWGDLVNNSLEEGKDISVEFDVESREYNGKWYTDVKVWRINKTDSSNDTNRKPAQNNSPSVQQPAAVSENQIDDDLPF